MDGKVLKKQQLEEFREYLLREEKSTATIEKYFRDVRAFFSFAEKQSITKEVTVAYKKQLIERGYASASINSMLASLNSFLSYFEWTECKVRSIRLQRKTYCAQEKELTKKEYMKLLKASERQPQLNLVMKTICGTGIWVSELQYFTVEAVQKGEVTVQCKNKTRTILIPGKLRKLLMCYANKKEILSGVIFISSKGKSLDRSRIWAQMKALCERAGVHPAKVFPHNLRKLFARTFYGIEKDIAKLADILGHGSIETTRIYIMTTGAEHLRKIEQLGLVI